jgi:hypothetical protein
VKVSELEMVIPLWVREVNVVKSVRVEKESRIPPRFGDGVLVGAAA